MLYTTFLILVDKDSILPAFHLFAYFYILHHSSENCGGLTFKTSLPCHHLVIPHKTITYVWGLMIFPWITAIAFKNFSFLLFLILYNLFSTKWSASLWCKIVKSIPVLKTLQWFHMSHRVKAKAYGFKGPTWFSLQTPAGSFYCLITYPTLPHWSPCSFPDIPVMFISSHYCSNCFPFQKHFLLDTYLANSLASFKPVFVFQLPQEGYLGCPDCLI